MIDSLGDLETVYQAHERAKQEMLFVVVGEHANASGTRRQAMTAAEYLLLRNVPPHDARVLIERMAQAYHDEMLASWMSAVMPKSLPSAKSQPMPQPWYRHDWSLEVFRDANIAVAIYAVLILAGQIARRLA